MSDDRPRADGEGRGAEQAGGPLHLLLEVQELDLELEQLAYRRRELGERGAVRDLEARLGALEQRAAAAGKSFEDLTSRQGELEAQITSCSSRIAAIEARLTEGGGGYRDLQAMSGEIDSLAGHRRELEDAEIEVMEQLEPVEKELESIRAEQASLAAEHGASLTALRAAEQEIDAVMTELRERRERLAAGLPAALAADYERLRLRLGGVGAARLVHGACSGCHLQLPSSERERLSHRGAGDVVHCEQCGRILVA
ncbi:MAG TPA: C4-type zinc ribbon domain-containing protein [Acidimicrobiales bacterium]|nr:C4-type zinc ribbon domain-containing protein [Acidimicrobiales bacterium]